MTGKFGVGFLGAGPVTQAIHLPTVAMFPEQLSVVHVMDVDESLARAVAARCPGAAASTDLDNLLGDERVEIVVVASPDRFHAEQVVAVCERGVRAVLCEKPLAVSQEEGRRIAEAARLAGVPILVGTMHAFDPAWQAAWRHWQQLDARAELVRCIAHLPSNAVFIDAATQLAHGSANAAPAGGSPDDRAALILRRSVLGLLIHTIPLIRHLVPELEKVGIAEGFEPFGSRLVIECGHATVQLHGLMPGDWAPDWRLQAWGKSHELTVRFPPSYVMGGSARASVSSGDCRHEWLYQHNGYRAEWRHLIDVAAGTCEPIFSIDAALADLSFALEICRLAQPQVGVGA